MKATEPVEPTLNQNEEYSKPEKKFIPNLLYPGYGLLLLSFSFYAAFEFMNVQNDSDTLMIFFVHYFFALAYVFILMFNGAYGIRKCWHLKNMDTTIILLNLFLVSAYALNKEVVVFENSTDWFCVYIIIGSMTTLSFRFFNLLPRWVNKLQYFLIGSALLLYLYLMLFVAGFYMAGSLGTLAFGIGAHVFVPLVLFVACIFLIKHSKSLRNISYYWIGAGSAITIAVAVAFTAIWTSRISEIERAVNQSVMYSDNELPVWIKVAESIENDWMTQRILKSDLVYTILRNNFGEWQFMPKTTSWDEAKRHDPLVFLASMISKCSLPAEERVKIIQAISDGRHTAQERLWTGDNLTTSYIVSDIDIFPELRIAYTEKYLNIKNNQRAGSWFGNTQEAIYTFQLPEGSVVTSLSLWINGKEEKGILTSKQKATKAYNTIVGVEQRDPSVIHWQEGNTVTVRIFPCTIAEERKFKIGITSPLVKKNDQTIYQAIRFQGPNSFLARETSRIRIIGSSTGIIIPDNFKKDKKGDYISEHIYNPDFEIAIKTTPIKVNKFSFNDFEYTLSEYKTESEKTDIQSIFLDINNSWDKSELEELKALLSKHKFYVYHDEVLIKLNSENWNEVTTEMHNRNFSLFPFHKIRDVLHTLVITKGKSISPHLSDVKESKFAELLAKFFAKNEKIKTYNLEGGTSSYVGSFRELRGLQFAEGSLANLISLLDSKTFPTAKESDEQIILHEANMILSKRKIENISTKDNAPDHLARLFAYNDIMRKVGVNYFNNDFINDELVDEAATAYVVSPVSSLIVLESQEDYKRFDITAKENSLLNASKNSSGAVPEPHEWALIILFAMLIIYMKVRHSKLQIPC